jgi:hypothetical protein
MTPTPVNPRNTIKKAGGRPSKFTNENIRQIRLLCSDGKTDAEIAKFLKISVDTLMEWKRVHPKFSKVMVDWKVKADAKVERALYKRAIGYKYDEVTHERLKIGGSDLEDAGGTQTPAVKVRVVTKEVAPDVTAQSFWLRNRKPKSWRDKVDVEHSGDLILAYGHRKQPNKV